IATSWPSMKPASFRPWPNTVMYCGVLGRNPTTGVADCCARTASCHPTAAAEQRYELPPFYLIELHSVPLSARAGLQDIESAKISQEVTERFYNLFSVR